MNNLHRRIAQALHGRHVDADVGARDVVEQGTVVDRVAREQRAGRLVPETDASRRVAGEMQYLVGAIVRVDDVTFSQEARGPCRFQPVGRHVESAVRNGGQ